MSLRSVSIVLALGLVCGLAPGVGCGSNTASKLEPGEPTTAKEKQLQEAKASGEVDDGNAKWGKWRYQGDRKDCFFVVGRRCFKSEKAACQAARCKAPATCAPQGAGPAKMRCE